MIKRCRLCRSLGVSLPEACFARSEDGIVARMSAYWYKSYTVSLLMDHLVWPATYRSLVFAKTHANEAGVMELAEYVLETLRQEGEFLL